MPAPLPAHDRGYPPPALPPLLEVEAERCRRSFRFFVEAVWPHVPRLATQGRFVGSWATDAICEHLQAVARRDIRFLLINVGPRLSGKTELCDILFPAWLWLDRPGVQTLFAAKVDKLVVRDSVRCREVIEQVPWYRQIAGVLARRRGEPRLWSLRDDSNRKNDFSNTAGGRRLSTSVTGTVIGEGADLIVGDDLQDVAGVESQTERQQTIEFWDQTLSSRANNADTVCKIMVQQRLHHDDLSAHLIASGRYVHLMLPTEYDPKRCCVTVVAGKEFWRDPRTTPGELLNPARFGVQAVTDAKSPGTGMGPVQFEVQHNQNPRQGGGGEFKASYWRFWKPAGVGSEFRSRRPKGCVSAEDYAPIELPRKLSKLISMDATFKDKKTGDWVVSVVLGWSGAQVFVLDMIRRQVDVLGAMEMLRTQSAAHPEARLKLVEEAANGPAIIQMLRGEIPGIVGVVPKGSKSSRARAWLHRVEAGQVYLPDGAPWLDVLVDEAEGFPNGAHDDCIDALGQGMARIDEGGGALERARVMGS